MKLPAPLKFTARFLPRNGIDCFVGLLVLIGGVLAGLFFGIGIMGILLLTGTFGMAPLLSQLLISGGLLYAAVMPLLRLEFSEEGILVVRLFQTLTIPWEEIESIEEVSPGEVARKMTQRDFITGKMAAPGSFTFTDYVLIRHSSGSILFPPQNKEIFLHELWKHRERNQVQLQEPTKTTPWYWTAQALREENQQTLRSRSQD